MIFEYCFFCLCNLNLSFKKSFFHRIHFRVVVVEVEEVAIVVVVVVIMMLEALIRIISSQQ